MKTTTRAVADRTHRLPDAALVCANDPAHRLGRLDAFWRRVEQQAPRPGPLDWLGFSALMGTVDTLMRGIPSFFVPNLATLAGLTPPSASRPRRTTAPRRCARRSTSCSTGRCCSAAAPA